jgi:hypothetical protein
MFTEHEGESTENVVTALAESVAAVGALTEKRGMEPVTVALPPPKIPVPPFIALRALRTCVAVAFEEIAPDEPPRLRRKVPEVGRKLVRSELTQFAAAIEGASTPLK